MRTGFCDFTRCSGQFKRKKEGNLLNMSELFDNIFLQDGHIGSGPSFLTFDSSPPSAGVDSPDRDELPE